MGVHRALKCWSGAGGRRSPSFFAIASELGSEPAGGASGATHHGPAPPAAADTRHKAAARARSETSPTADCWGNGLIENQACACGRLLPAVLGDYAGLRLVAF